MPIIHANQRKVRIIEVPESAIIALFSNAPIFPTFEPLPEGVKFTEVHHNPARELYSLVIQHDSFDPVNEGAPLPVMEVTWGPRE